MNIKSHRTGRLYASARTKLGPKQEPAIHRLNFILETTDLLQFQKEYIENAPKTKGM